MSTCAGGAPGKSAPHRTRTTTNLVESLSSLAQHPALLVLVWVLLTVLIVVFPALKLVVIGFFLGAVTR